MECTANKNDIFFVLALNFSDEVRINTYETKSLTRTQARKHIHTESPRITDVEHEKREHKHPNSHSLTHTHTHAHTFFFSSLLFFLSFLFSTLLAFCSFNGNRVYVCFFSLHTIGTLTVFFFFTQKDERKSLLNNFLFAFQFFFFLLQAIRKNGMN